MTTITKEGIDQVQESASTKLCNKEEDTIVSETALRIIKLVESKNKKNKKTR